MSEIKNEEHHQITSLVKFNDTIYVGTNKGLFRMDSDNNFVEEKLEKEPDYKAIAEELADKAKAVIERWDSPLWKDVPHTAEYINELRQALAKYEELKK